MAITAIALPAPDQAGSFLSMMLARPAKISKGPRLSRRVPQYVAVFRDEKDRPWGAVLVEPELARSLGAALSLIPKGVAMQGLETNEMAPELEENIFEVMNICAQWFHGKGRPAMSLRKVWAPDEELPKEVRKMLARGSSRRDYQMEVATYGAGKLALVAL